VISQETYSADKIKDVQVSERNLFRVINNLLPLKQSNLAGLPETPSNLAVFT